MPFEFDDEQSGSAGSFVFDDDQPKKKGTQSLSTAIDTIKNYGLGIVSGAGGGVADAEAAAGTFLQAPSENIRAGVVGSAAAVDRGVTNLQNWVSPGSSTVNPVLQEFAQDSSAEAAQARSRNLRMNGTSAQDLARMGLDMERDGRYRGESIRAFDAENNPELIRQQQEVGRADGFVDSAKALVDNPLAFTHSLAKSAPAMAAGAGLAGAAANLAGGSARVAGLVGTGAEGASAAMQSREAVYGQVAGMPVEQLEKGSDRYREILARVGDPIKARTVLANELADQAPVLVGAGTVAGSWLTNKLFGGDKSAEILAGKRIAAKDIPRNFVQEGSEEVLQGIPEDLTQHTALSQAAPTHKLDLAGSAVQNFAAGGVLGGGGSAGAYAGQRYNDFRTGKPVDDTPSAPPAVPPADQGGGAVNASEILGAPTSRPDTGTIGTTDTTESDKALRTPVGLTALDRVTEIDQAVAAAPVDAPEIQTLRAERDSLTKEWPTAIPGNSTAFSTESGSKLEGQYALIDADQLVTSHDTNLRANPAYPKELQPRERDRAASELQVSGIVQKLDPARLGVSADSATGAPIVGADGLVESGNARTIALKRIYQANGQKAADYKQFLSDNASQFGITPESVQAMGKPVLVRVRSTPVNRAEFARQANASTVAQMSPSEQAKTDSKRIESMDDLNPDDNGDFGTSREFIRRFMARLPSTEQGGMIDADGKLSTTGYTRISNAVLAKAYGDSPVLARMVESRDDNLRNVSKALLVAAPTVAKMRQAMEKGSRFDADITPDLMEAVEELSRLKDSGTSVSDALAQAGMFGDKYSPETRALLQFLADNIRRPRKIADFITAYMDALDAAGDPNQGSLLGDVQPPAKGDLLTAAKEGIEGNGTQDLPTNTPKDTQRGNTGEGAQADKSDRGQPQDAPGDSGRNEGAGAAGSETRLSRDNTVEKSEWVNFPKESGTIGIPRADMPQIKSEHRGALLQFLQARGIDNKTKDVPSASLKPTQAEFSIKKTARWGEVRDGSDRSVLISSDGHILDGHHQWMAAVSANEPVKAIVLDAPIRELLANVFQFPSVQQSVESATAKAQGDKARDDFKAAMADLADLMADKLGLRVMMMPPGNPELRQILVRLFTSAIEVVGTDLKAATKWVKDKLKADPETKPWWNKVTDKDYQAAAVEAVEQGAKQHVDDLFAAAEKRQAGLFDDAPAAPKAAMIDGHPYNYAFKGGDNFETPATSTFIPSDVLAKAKDQIDRLHKAASPVQISKEDRARAEKLLTPLLERANAAKVEYDQKIIDIAKSTGALGQMLTTVKSLDSATRKFATDPGVDWDLGKMYDMLRSTIVVSNYGDAQNVLDAIRAAFDVLPGRIKNMTDAEIDGKKGAFLPSGYGQVLVNVKLPGAVIAEIQINVPEMLAVKMAEGHALYEIERAEKDGSKAKADAVATQREIYPLAAAAAVARSDSSLDLLQPGDIGKSRAEVKRSSPVSSSNTNTRPSGNLTHSMASPLVQNSQPGGNLSGTLISTPLTGSVSEKSKKGYDTPDLFGDSDGDTTSGQGGSTGKGAGSAQATGGKREAGAVREGSGGPDQFGSGVNDAGATPQTGLGQDGPNGVRGNDENGGKSQSGNSAFANAGVPAGRDIPAKSGRNYEFGPDDLTYEGSWPKKAAQNVDAVELVKKLEAEGRQATPEEQKTLAKFVGWGSSELANNLFGTKLDKAAKALEDYREAAKAMDTLQRDYLQKGGQYRGQYADNGYYQAVSVLRTAGKINQYDMPQRITRQELDAAKPDASTQRWLELRDRLRAVMSKDELAEASRSTQYAHYTSKAVVQSMWKAMERMGFKGGTILEPGAGIGVFPGLMPQAMATNSIYTGIEFDSITGGVLKQLFPDERILVESFVDSKLPKNFYDVAVGNPPFSGTKILSDPEYSKRALSLHDYFFAKSIDRVKPGGLVVYITSRYTMDKIDDKARQYLSERADLVGAIRLPQTAFKQNAGTEVVTDVIFLRKKVKGENFDHAQTWGKVGEIKGADGKTLMVKDQHGTEKPAMVNEYFAAHPEMVLGNHANTGSMYSDQEYTVAPMAGNIEDHFAKAVENLPADIYQAPRGSSAEAAKVREIDFNPKAKKEGNYYLSDAGVLMQREGGVGQRVELRSAKDAELIKDFVPLRDALKQAHYDQLNGGAWEQSLKALQDAYAKFTKKNGQVNQFVAKTVSVKVDELDDDGNPTGRKVADEEVRRSFPVLDKLVDDPDWTLVAALETLNEDTGEIKPSAFLNERVLGKAEMVAAATPVDAMLTTLNDLGHVDMGVIAQRVGLTEAQTIEALGSSVYNDPESGWVTADDYLSGNVKKKLELARLAAKTDQSLERNVTALEANQPEPLMPSQIDPRLGMNWIPGDVYQQFISDITNGATKVNVEWSPRTKSWSIEAVRGHQSDAATSEWGTLRRNVVDLLEHAVTGRPIRIESKADKGDKPVFDPAATEAANEKLKALHDKFASWVFSEPTRTDTLVRLYNDKFNTTVARSFDGKHLTLPGTSKTFNVFDHVKRGAWRIIQSGNTYLAHAVGSGKTFQMVISAMEQKRLGLVKKPMIVVPGHMLKQFASEWQQLYPAARLMIADEHNFHTDNRRRFVSRVALSDLDGVVITHSAFKLLDLDPDFKAKIIDEQLEYMRAALEEAGGKEGEKSRDPKIKRIEKQIENLEEKLKASLSSEGKDKNVRFDELGVDFLYVDEAHEFRKLDFATARQVKGLSPMGSARAFDLYMKSRYLEEKTPGRSLVLASGTPVTNTVAELYTVQKMLGYQALVDKGIEDFDSWAAMFGRERTALEPNAAGKYELVTRFQDFANVPELTQMFREFADVLTSDHLAEMLGDKRPKVDGGARSIIVTPETAEYEDFRTELEQRMEASKKWKPSKDEPNNPDPVIRIIGDGRLAAIDMRFIHPSLPSNPDSKLNRMIDDVIAAMKDTAGNEYRNKAGEVEPNKGAAAMVFSDLGFGAGVAAHRGFNARAWFEKRLRDAGIPMDQVAFMSDYKKSSAKLKLFSDVNAGRVRLLIGSSKNMGTGVNAQQRLKDLFHLDSPWYPADLEQREGRIIRQGNKNPLVRIKAYAAKGTYDQQMWGQLANKQMFIDKAMSGDPSVRKIEDAGSADLMAMVAGMVAKDPRVLQLAGLDAEISKLQRLYQAHEDARATYRGRFNEAKWTAEWNESRLPDAQKVAGQAQDLSGDKFTAKVGGATYTERSKWAEALIAKYKDLTTRGETQVQKVGEISGFAIAYGGETVAGLYRTKLMLDTPNPMELVSDPGTSPVGVAMRAQNAVVDVARLPVKMRERINEARAQMDGLSTKMDAPFPMAGMLADKTRERNALVDEMAAKDTGKPEDSENQDAPKLSRGTGAGMDHKELSGLVSGITSKMQKMPKVHVLADPSQAPQALQDYIRKQDAWADVEGAYHNGELYMFASGLSGALRAEHVLAEHEAGHFGLRAILGSDLSTVMNMIWANNGPVRKAAAELQKRGKLSNAEATEEVIVDIPSADLMRLKGWRKVVMKVRDFLLDHGFEAMGTKLTQFLNGTLSYQQRADLMVADLVRSARGAVAGTVPVKFAAAKSAMALSTSLSDDAAKQEKWLAVEARARGYKDIDTLAEQDYPLFEKLAELWRKKNPADNGVLLSRRFMALVHGQSELDAAIKEAGKGLQKAIDDKRGTGTVVLGRSPHVLSMLAGAVLESPRPMVVAPGILNKTVAEPGTVSGNDVGKHFGDLDGVKGEDLARAIYRPAAVVGDPSQAGNYNIVTNILTPKGPLVVNVNTAGTAMVNGKQQPVVFVNSIYAREAGEVGLWLNGKEYTAKRHIQESRRAFHYIDQTQIGEAVTGRLNPENKNPAFKGRDLLVALGAVNTSPVVPQTALSPISSNTSIVSKYGSPANENYRGLAAVDAGLQRWVTGKGLKPGLKPAKTYGNLLAWIDKQYKGDAADKPMFSRAPVEKPVAEHADTIISTKTASERADDIIHSSAATATPLDAAAKFLTRIGPTVAGHKLSIEGITSKVYDKAGFILDRFTPERVKAGMVSDYGVPEAVIDQRALMQGNQRKQLREAGNLIDKLSTLTRAESRVAHAWMNEKDPEQADQLMKQLPAESVVVLKEVQQMIDRLSQEAVELGQLSPEAFKQNRFAYLRRSYVKHTMELTKGESASRSRAISILGDQYKGRGMTDATPMLAVQGIAPGWWKRKLQAGKADASLNGEKFLRLERRAPSGEGTKSIEGIEDKSPGKLLEVHYFPAGEVLPAKYQDWNQSGTWEVRDVKGPNLVMWRDFTKAEREKMGEIDEARFAIAKTLHGMIHDVEVGRYLEWIARKQGKQEGEEIPGEVVDASESALAAFKPGQWVRVPDSKIAGTNVHKYGLLAGRYIPGPVWNDVRQTVGGQFKPLGDTYAKILSIWKTSKTALSPAVHMNNVMSNFVMADWHDVTAGHTVKALRIIMGAHGLDGKGYLGAAGNKVAGAIGHIDREAAREIVNRYQDSGGDIGSWATAEIARDQMEPLLAAMEKELAATQGESHQAQTGVYAALQMMMEKRFADAFAAAKGSKVAQGVVQEASTIIDLYQSEDEVFRLASWLKAKEEGQTDQAAGKLARKSFMDYNINAPWVAAARNTALPFVSYSYRAIPMFAEIAAKKPHKLMKLMLLAGAVNALGVMLAGGDDDKERKLLPEEKAGRIWGMVPKLIRMPWNLDREGSMSWKNGDSPVYLDIRRFIPVGDVVDIGQGHSAIPLLPSITPGGPLANIAELVLNKQQFTGKPITLETDTKAEAAMKVLDYVYKTMMPNLLGLPGTYATKAVLDAGGGKTDAFGREQSVLQALASSFGIKLGTYPADVLRKNLHSKAQAEIMEIEKNIHGLRREFAAHGIDAVVFAKKVQEQKEKEREVLKELVEKMR